MIKNIVFDFGQVLVHYVPHDMAAPYATDPADIKLLADVVFDRAYWDLLDRGTITDEEVIARCQERLPARLHDTAREVYENWIHHIPEMEGMNVLVREVKETLSVKTFLLSNISRYFYAHRDNFPILREMTFCVYSALCGYAKPEREIYEYLCLKADIHPEETLFIDDKLANIEGAEAYGIHGYHFDGDVEKLRAFLLSLPRE